ncbi:alpha/beta hydrolase [Coralloluteibacterium stylophorae]|uniref:Alpha/beta hydrolase n=1 Tax=Coralloluteibacterium stylophorae TaxID=1776034 RepID=A0A8J7VRU1_9GAMM|nr:alpha/beta hydrolase [Coralloluteibacterium stylophorae]MBS7458094.1 alpha/beta hydrolase [Coralloluteibacterium stylophorae]
MNKALRALACALVCAAAPIAQAQQAAPAPLVVDLWPEGHLANAPNDAPEQVGSDGSARGAVRNVMHPRLEIHRAAQPNGSAMLVLGGGGYFRIQIGSAARPTAQWLAAIGVTSAVLYYRLPADGWPASAPFADAQRAMRILRAHAGEWGIDPERIGAVGFSAGANLAGILGTRADEDFYAPLDATDRLPARPALVGMIYPVVSLRAPLDGTRTRRELDTQADAVEAYSVELHVDDATPPTFLAHAADDPIADVGHSLTMFDALRGHGVPAALHVFAHGGHSWGLGTPGSEPADWPRLFANWARGLGVFDPARADPRDALPEDDEDA